MPKIALEKKRRPNCVQWVREELGLSQRQLAELIGTSIFTIQSVETGRVRVSKKNAARLSAATGAPAAWFRANKLAPPLPDTAKLRAHFEHFDEAQQGVSAEGTYLAALLPRMFINKLAWLADAVADKHGDYTACRRAGFIDALGTAGMKILATIDDPEQREAVFMAYSADIKGGDAELISRFAAKNREIQRVLREEKRKAAAAGVTPPQYGGGALFSAWARAAGIPPAKGSRSVAWPPAPAKGERKLRRIEG